MDRATVDVYEANASEWVRRRGGRPTELAAAFARRVADGGVRADLGCGPGFHLGALGTPLVALDATFAMLEEARRRVPGTPVVRGDLEALPVRTHALAGAWAAHSYVHVPRERLPLAFAELHRVLAPGAPFELSMIPGEHEGPGLPDDDFPGRYFSLWQPEPLADVLVGAGFELAAVEHPDRHRIQVRGTRGRTLSDVVGPSMRLLVCGLNPSLYAADAGVGFARPGNRFWPAALEAGLATRDRDPLDALARHGIGFTDLVKRATVAASELTDDEYRSGAARVERLVAWLQPAAVCFVGLAGYRAAVDRRARPGAQAAGFAGVPTYVMPSTSGLNARVTVAEHATHLRNALALGRS